MLLLLPVFTIATPFVAARLFVSQKLEEAEKAISAGIDSIIERIEKIQFPRMSNCFFISNSGVDEEGTEMREMHKGSSDLIPVPKEDAPQKSDQALSDSDVNSSGSEPLFKGVQNLFSSSDFEDVPATHSPETEKAQNTDATHSVVKLPSIDSVLPKETTSFSNLEDLFSKTTESPKSKEETELRASDLPGPAFRSEAEGLNPLPAASSIESKQAAVLDLHKGTAKSPVLNASVSSFGNPRLFEVLQNSLSKDFGRLLSNIIPTAREIFKISLSLPSFRADLANQRSVVLYKSRSIEDFAGVSAIEQPTHFPEQSVASPEIVPEEKKEAAEMNAPLKDLSSQKSEKEEEKEEETKDFSSDLRMMFPEPTWADVASRKQSASASVLSAMPDTKKPISSAANPSTSSVKGKSNLLEIELNKLIDQLNIKCERNPEKFRSLKREASQFLLYMNSLHWDPKFVPAERLKNFKKRFEELKKTEPSFAAMAKREARNESSLAVATNQPSSASVIKQRKKAKEAQIFDSIDEDQVVIFPRKEKKMKEESSISPAVENPKSIRKKQELKEINSHQISNVLSTNGDSDFGDCSASLARIAADLKERQAFWAEQKPKAQEIGKHYLLLKQQILLALSTLPEGADELQKRLSQLNEKIENQLIELKKVGNFAATREVRAELTFDSFDKKLIVSELDKFEKRLFEFESEFTAIEEGTLVEVENDFKAEGIQLSDAKPSSSRSELLQMQKSAQENWFGNLFGFRK